MSIKIIGCIYFKQNEMITQKQKDNKCIFCNDTGLVKTFSFDNERIPDGSYLLNDLIEKFGEYIPCCEGCKVMN